MNNNGATAALEGDHLRSRFRGSLLGLAIGDVLGCPVESKTSGEIREHFGIVDRLVTWDPEKAADSYFWRMPGLHSDDTQQALSVADVLAEQGRVEAERLLGIWLQMARADTSTQVTDPATGKPKKLKAPFGCHRGTGSGFRRALRALAKSPRSTPSPASYSDGAAMRVAPVGLLFREDSTQRAAQALASSVITHRHPHALESAVAVAAAVAHALDPAALAARSLLEKVAIETAAATTLATELADSKVCIHAGEFAGTLSLLPELLGEDLSVTLKQISERAERCLGRNGIFATQSAAIAAVSTALLVAARHLDDYHGAIVEAIALGGDTDTVAAIVGAIVGARVGVERLPAEWQASVLAAEQVILRADALLDGTRGERWGELVAIETAWTRQEVVARWRMRLDLV